MKNKFLESAKDDGIELIHAFFIYPFMFFVLSITFIINAILIMLGLVKKLLGFIFMRGSHE